MQRAFYFFLREQDVDTDCVEDEVERFQDEKESNLYHVLREDDDIMRALRRFLRHHKIMNQSFATGFPLFYWKWYRTATEEQVQGNGFLASYIDLRGHSVQELSVDQQFDNLKEEALATGLINPEQFEKLVVQKAKQYMKTAKCRKMKCKSFWSSRGNDPLHFDIPNGTPLTEQHLQSIILYCDFTKLCTLFSESLRQNDSNEGLQEIKKKNSKFFHFSKLLRELVTYFGSNGGVECCKNPWCDIDVSMNGVARGPFFSGVSTILNLSDFSIGFNTPT